MAPQQSDDAFAEIKSKVDLVKLVQEQVRLTKRNRDFVGLCPFHQEDTPSFTVHPDKQSWYCFGCQRHGDVFTFVELIEETARRFQLGYAPAGRGFAEYLRAKKRSLADAQVAGLMRRDGSDFFAERLVIPIRDERGQPLAFTARAVRQDEQRKYINSPETP